MKSDLSTVAFLCSGQGSQFVGMAKDLYDSHELAKSRFAEAQRILGYDIAEICFYGPEDVLRQTRVTQPALYIHSMIAGELLAEHSILPSCAGGHSLGEYSALASAAAFTFETGLELVRVRAEAMQEAGNRQPGTMAAVVGISNETVEQICADCRNVGIVVPANYNSPGQLVISGEIPAVEKAMELCKSAGAKLVRKLVVSGAFHSPLMESAAAKLGNALAECDIRSPRVPVVSNVSGEVHSDVDSIRQSLASQLLSPVRWTDCLVSLNKLRPAKWYEVGPGNVLTGLLKRTIAGESAETVGTQSEIERILSEVEE